MPGSGEVFDWSLADGAPSSRRIILAGGLTPTNVAEGIAKVQPWGVDVSSGVEVDGQPGRKDPRKVQAFMRDARTAAPDPSRPSSPGPVRLGRVRALSRRPHRTPLRPPSVARYRARPVTDEPECHRASSDRTPR